MRRPVQYDALAVEATILKELRNEWRLINEALFASQLRIPVFQLGDSVQRLGSWCSNHRTMEISRTGLHELSWAQLVEIVKHETAHQYVQEVLGIHNETDHGPTFRSVCRDRAIDPRAMLPVENRKISGESRHSRIVEKIQLLLALAGSPNEHEARNAMATAKRLMLKHNVNTEDTKDEDYGHVHMGKPTGRVPESQRWLANILSNHFFVEAIWIPVFVPQTGKRGHVLELCGSQANLEISSYVFDYLNQTSERLWKDHKREKQIQGNRDRLRFVAGVMYGFNEKLDGQAKQDKQEGLIWAGDPMLRDFLKRRYPRTRTVSRRGGRICDAHTHGRRAGKDITLHRGMNASQSGATRLLKA